LKPVLRSTKIKDSVRKPYINNCIIQPRGNERIVNLKEDGIDVFLDGYAIIPIELFEDLKKKAGGP
jgi:hypothetical protein